MGRVGFGALNFSSSPAFSAPLQKSLDMGTAHTTPASIPEPVVATKVVEEVLVSTSTYVSPKEPAQTSTVTMERVEVKEEVLTGVNKKTAEEAKAKLTAAGATVELK
jgi:hypothetical protein